MKRYIVTRSEDERKTLGDLTSKGTQKSQKILNALILLVPACTHTWLCAPAFTLAGAQERRGARFDCAGGEYIGMRYGEE
jgi:hypothetical protein